MEVRPATPSDHDWILEVARTRLGDERQVHSQRQFHVLDADVLVAPGQGFATWEVDGDEAEVMAIATIESVGAGRALMSAVARAASERGCRSIRVVTTDANVGAQRFYEHLGYALAERRVGAVDECRQRYKPSIPPDMHDELVYRHLLA